MSKSLKVVLGAVVALVVVVAGLGAWTLLRDTAKEEASVGAIGGTTAPAGSSSRATPDGQWKIAPGESVFVGFRVHEKLRGLDKDVTGRTPDVEGTMTVAGGRVTATEVKADLTGLTTDDPMRDGAIKRMGLETNTYPEGTFSLTEPITLPADAQIGQEVAVTAKGTLTLRNTARPVEVPLAAVWDGDQIRTATSGGGVRVQFQDHGFGALSVPVAETDDFGYFELQLLWVPA